MVSLELSEKVAVVTGAGSGIGFATCRRFLEAPGREGSFREIYSARKFA
jgi:NAD(P)-dependent dehydrogenase (short-subunit alcohol dehydrogenase family)